MHKALRSIAYFQISAPPTHLLLSALFIHNGVQVSAFPLGLNFQSHLLVR